MDHSCFDLHGRVAVVIGGTSGLGRAISLGLAAHGATVVPCGRRADAVAATCAELRALGRETLEITVDVTDPQSIAMLHARVVERWAQVEILVNAAGVTFRQPTVEVASQDWSALFKTNLDGVFEACQAFYNNLRASGRGRIINIASLGSFVAFQEVAAYCASKAAVLSLTRSLAIEWARDHICVNAIAPGVFPTELNSKLLNGTARGREILLRTPMQRFGNPDEVIGTAVLLASDAVSFMTGQCITVDGGFLASGVNT